MSLSSFGLGCSLGLKTKTNSSQGHKINEWRNWSSNRDLSKDEIFVALWPDWCWAMLIPHYNTELSKQGKEKLLFLVELWYKEILPSGLKTRVSLAWLMFMFNYKLSVILYFYLFSWKRVFYTSSVNSMLSASLHWNALFTACLCNTSMPVLATILDLVALPNICCEE